MTMKELLDVMDQPLSVIIALLAFAGAVALLKLIIDVVREQLIPAYVGWKLERRKLILPTAVKVLDREEKQPTYFRDGGPKFADFEHHRVYIRPEVERAKSHLKNARFLHICGSPSTGKSVIAKTIAYMAIKEGATVYYFVRPSLVPELFYEVFAQSAASRLDKSNVLFIIDDVHLDLTAASRLFSFLYGRFENTKLMFVSRPIPADVAQEDDGVPFPFSRYMQQYEIRSDVAAERLAEFYSQAKFSKPIPAALCNQFMNECAGDLLILGRYLREWDGKSPDLKDLRNRVSEHVLRDILAQRAKSPTALEIYHVLSLFYRFEIPIETNFLKGLGLDPTALIRIGSIREAAGYCSLHHSSLARLYSTVIQGSNLPEASAVAQKYVPYPLALFREYVRSCPRNFCEMVVGLRHAPEIGEELLKEAELEPFIRRSLEREAGLSMLGWALLIISASLKRDDWRILRELDIGKNAQYALGKADSEEVSLFLFNMRKVSHTKAVEWLKCVSAVKLADAISGGSFREVARCLLMIDRFSEEIASEVSSHISGQKFCDLFAQEETLFHVRLGLARLCRLMLGRLAVRVHEHRDTSGEWSTRVVLYCDVHRAVRFFRGRGLEIPYGHSVAAYRARSTAISDLRSDGNRIVIDSGAAAAIRRRQSLFPVGITRVDGKFESGVVVDIVDEEGLTIAYGVSNFSSSELARVKGRSSRKIADEVESLAPNKVMDNDRMFMLEGNGENVLERARSEARYLDKSARLDGVF